MKWQILQLLYRYLHTNINQHTCLKDVLWKGYIYICTYMHVKTVQQQQENVQSITLRCCNAAFNVMLSCLYRNKNLQNKNCNAKLL